MTLKGINNQKILFVSANCYPPVAGDSLYSFGIIQLLNENNQLTVLSLSSVDAEAKNELPNCRWITLKENEGLLKYFFRYVNYFSFSMISPLRIDKKELNTCWDLVVIDHLRSYGMISRVLRYLNFSKLIYLAHNIEYINRKQKIAFSESLVEGFKESLNFGLFFQEKKLINIASNVLALTDYDAYVIRNRFLKTNVSVQGPAYRLKNIPKQKRGSDILLIGSLNWFPNRLGVADFLEKVSPQILFNRSIIIVGSYPTHFREKWNMDKVEFYGFIEDLESIYGRCEYLVVPNQFGTGIKMKILDGLNNGLKVLAVREAAVGYAHKTDNLEVFSSVSEINEFLLK